MIVIGSQALRTYTDLPRVPADLDLVGSYKEMLALVEPGRPCYPVDGGKKFILKNHVRIVEFEIAWPGSTAEIIVQLSGGTLFGGASIAPIEMLLALKVAHRFKEGVHFQKTMDDIRIMREMGVTVPERYQAFVAMREAEALNYSHPKLNVSKDAFFSPVVPYIYDHDSVHEVMKHYGTPAYQFFKPEGSEVLTSRTMFEHLPNAIKLHAVLEEAYVLALERSQIPHADKITPHASFLIALQKVCTSITSGWFREFAWENYYEVRKMYRDTYVPRFWEHVRLGKVKLHTAAGTEGPGLATDNATQGFLG